MKARRVMAILISVVFMLTGCADNSSNNSSAEVVQSEPATTNDVKQEYQADVVVIGAGGAGMSAAIKASDAGASVVILEKMNYAGGNTTRAEGGMNAAETSYQKALGIEDTVETMIKDTMKGGKEINDPELVKYLAENSAETIDWLTSLGMDVSDVGQGAGATFPRMHRAADGSKIGGVLIPKLMENLEKRNVRILYKMKAVELIKDGDFVAGVIAEDEDGNKLTFKANAVVNAAGGFGANEAMYAEYRPDLKGFETTNHPGATGDGIVLAEALGAATVDMDKIQTNPTVEVTTQTVISETVRGKGAIFVNQEGKRFISEMLTRDVLSAEILKQNGKFAYLIFDQRVMDSMAALQEDYEKGLVTKGEDVADLAQALGLDATVLADTIASWNTAVANNKDTQFERNTGMDEDLSLAPYYAIKVSPAVHHTMGGIKINTLTQVIDRSGNPIQGLFAAGEVTGGVHGANRLGGNAVADIMVFGTQAGVESSKFALSKGKLELILPEAKQAVIPSTPGNFKDGVYEGTAQGKEGDIKVHVEIKAGNIVNIEIVELHETAAIFDGVKRELLPKIIEKQSTDVDAVSGATLSSEGVLQAVDQALASAK